MIGKNLPIGKRLSAVFAVVLLLMASVGVVGVQGVRSVSKRTEKVFIHDAKIADGFAEVRSLALELRRYEKNIFIRIGSTDERAKKDFPRWMECVERLKKRLASMEAAVTDGKDREALSKIRTGLDSYTAGFKAVQARIYAGELQGAAQADAALGSARDTMNDVNKRAEESVGRWQKVMQEEERTVSGINTKMQSLIVIFAVVAFLFSTLACYLLSASLTGPIGTMQSVLEALAKGDLTQRVKIDSRDELGKMGVSFNGIVDRLQEIMSRLAHDSKELITVANEVFATSRHIAAGTEEVANQTTTVAAASEEMVASSAEIASNCSGVVDTAGAASSFAASGMSVVEDTVQEMNRIARRVNATAATVESLGTRSDQIGEIIGTIEDIADQTNLLALNAAIEAARAGEQGRGFAVVADEVRALAERTTSATKRIGEMIKNIQEETKVAVLSMKEGVCEVEKGTSEAARSGEALREILTHIDQVTGQVHQIATAAQEQTATISEISSNIQGITGVMENTFRDVKQSSLAASHVAKTAEEFREVLSFFKTGPGRS